MNMLFLGDSLIEYFDWQGRFPQHNIVNLGIAGESVEGLLSRVMRIRERYSDADMIFIMSGINNVAMGDTEFIEFYRIILEKLFAAYPKAKIYIHSLLPTVVDFIPDESIRLVNNSLLELARQSGVEYLDIFTRFLNTKGRPVREYLLDDGVHLSSHGYSVWSKVIEGIIKQK
ncbi:MAG: GDSL family lipase [Nitrospiraceae bacterium]|nr:MAG: GDSL family lipase [Nitrospiraceae bacterium]